VLFILAAVILTVFCCDPETFTGSGTRAPDQFYLMAQLGITNWMRFIIWLIVGLVIYFSYSRRHSKLKMKMDAHVAD